MNGFSTPINIDDPELDAAIRLVEPLGRKTFRQVTREILDGLPEMTYDRAYQLADWVTQLRAMTEPVEVA
jgi:hypothetical protein